MRSFPLAGQTVPELRVFFAVKTLLSNDIVAIKSSGGVNLNAATGIRRVSVAFAVSIETLAVIPGLSFKSGLSTWIMTV